MNDSLVRLLRSNIKKSSKQEFFSALQSTLRKECSNNSTPNIQMNTTHHTIPHSVGLRDHHLQMRYKQLYQRYPYHINRLASFHCHYASIVERDRYKMLQYHPNSPVHVQQCNAYFDSALHSVMDQVENSLCKLEKENWEQTTMNPINASKFSSLSKLEKESWEQTTMNPINASKFSSLSKLEKGSCEQTTMNPINASTFSSLSKLEKDIHEQTTMNPINTSKFRSLSELGKENPEQTTMNPIDVSKFRTRSTLPKKAIDTMQDWFQSNIHYPYPSETVVKLLSEFGGITEYQVRKWFSNKRNRYGCAHGKHQKPKQ